MAQVKMKKSSGCVVYVLTSEGSNYFANMTWLSIMSLSLSNPSIEKILVCDFQTKYYLEQINHIVLGECDRLIEVKTPQGKNEFRNRYIKTSLRQRISGSFLYLDADTLIRGDLSPIFQTEASFSAATNHSGSGLPQEIPQVEKAVFENLGWPLPQKHYINGGVLFFKEDRETHNFCELWHHKWLESFEKTGSSRDQPSLNSALSDSNISFSLLPHKFNAQVEAKPSYAPEAVVWHLYSSSSMAMQTLFDQYLEYLMSDKNLPLKKVEQLCQRSHPWPTNNLIDRWCAGRLLQHESISFSSFERLWMRRQHQQAIIALLKQIKKYVIK